MALLRRLQFALSFLLAVLLVGGSILPPSVAVWQCRHAARVVDAAFAPAAMPCRMGRPMPAMACCRAAKVTAAKVTAANSAALHPAPCHPTLTRLSALPAPAVTEHARLRRSLASAQAVLPVPAALPPPAPLVLIRRPRPPPSLIVCAAPKYVPGLRAPPPS